MIETNRGISRKVPIKNLRGESSSPFQETEHAFPYARRKRVRVYSITVRAEIENHEPSTCCHPEDVCQKKWHKGIDHLGAVIHEKAHTDGDKDILSKAKKLFPMITI